MTTPFNPQPLTFNQTQTPSNVVDRSHFRTPQFPGPVTPSQQFTMQKGRNVLPLKSQEALDRVVLALKRRREGSSFAKANNAAGAFGKAFRF